MSALVAKPDRLASVVDGDSLLVYTLVMLLEQFWILPARITESTSLALNENERRIAMDWASKSGMPHRVWAIDGYSFTRVFRDEDFSQTLLTIITRVET